MYLAVVNESSLFDSSDAQDAVAACAAQLKLHVAPLWDRLPSPVVFYENRAQVPDAADVLVILDDEEKAEDLGYHHVTPDGKPYARVFVAPILKHGGTPSTGPVSVTAVMSHEVCEWFGDPLLNLWADNGRGDAYAVELCDPVDEDYYELSGISVSNFVTKQYFNYLAEGDLQFDYCRRLSAPFSMTSGGMVIRRPIGESDKQFADAYPSWRKAAKSFPAARTARRLAMRSA